MRANSSEKINAYTDGACQGNPGPGGWGVYAEVGDKVSEWAGKEPATTNQRMELTAAIQALERLSPNSSVVVHTDSKYVVSGIQRWIRKWENNGWRTAGGKAVKNRDLWERLQAAKRRHKLVVFRWVRGHDGNLGNERADRLAVEGGARTSREEYLGSLGLSLSILKLGSTMEARQEEISSKVAEEPSVPSGQTDYI
jgi:ribonuclease HI